MRFLPTIEIGHQIIQFPLPDIHAIKLAEISLTQLGDRGQQGLQELLLDSPMLLSWLFAKADPFQNRSGKVPMTEEKLEIQLISVLMDHAPLLVRDNIKPLSLLPIDVVI